MKVLAEETAAANAKAEAFGRLVDVYEVYTDSWRLNAERVRKDKEIALLKSRIAEIEKRKNDK